MKDANDLENWLLLPPGDKAICRTPLDDVPEGCHLASVSDVLSANLGRPFPWGQGPQPNAKAKLWNEKRMGYGGLYHDKWFVTKEGRVGGAQNVPQSLPGSLRSCFLYDGGFCEPVNQLAENEGFAVIKPVSALNRDLYRKIQMHAAEHVVADGGSIIVAPIENPDEVVRVGFVGRCQHCPNPEMISFRQLQKAVPEYRFELLNEWKGWSLETEETPQNGLDF